MNALKQLLTSSLGKKYIMAITGLYLVLFVFGHMVGNLQIFMGPEAINAYAHKLQSLPAPILWGFRLSMLLAVGIHVWAAVALTLENRTARDPKTPVSRIQATFSSRTMRATGVVLLVFILFHILHFTVRSIFDYSALPMALIHGDEPVFDVFSMMVGGFSKWWVSLFYTVSMALLCLHLSHGVASMFQTVGLRNERYRYGLNRAASVYGWIVFLGFAVIPVGVFVSLNSGLELIDETHYNRAIAEARATEAGTGPAVLELDD